MKFIYEGKDKNLNTVRGIVEAESIKDAVHILKKEMNVTLIFELRQKREIVWVEKIKTKVKDQYEMYSAKRKGSQNKGNENNKEKDKKENSLNKSIQKLFEKLVPDRAVSDEEKEHFLQQLLDRLRDIEIKTEVVPDDDGIEPVNFNIFAAEPKPVDLPPPVRESHSEGDSSILSLEDEEPQKPQVQFSSRENFRRQTQDRQMKFDFSKLGTPTKESHKLKVPAKEVRMFSKRLAILLQSGLSISKALTILSDTKNKTFKKIINLIHDDVQEGYPLSYAMAKFPRQFDQLYVAMVAIGESSGSLPECIKDVVESQNRRAKLRAKLLSAMIYPAIILCVITLILFFGSIFFIPMFEELFLDIGIELPLITRIVFWAAHRIQFVILTPIVFLFLVLTLKRRVGIINEYYTRIKDRLVLKIPVVKGLSHSLIMFNFFNTMGLMVKNGIRMLDSLKLASNAVANTVIQGEIALAQDQVLKGIALSESLKTQPHFESLATSIVYTGEESGSMNMAFKEISDYYAELLDDNIEKMMKWIEPASLLLIAAILGPVLVGIFLPLMEISTGAGQI